MESFLTSPRISLSSILHSVRSNNHKRPDMKKSQHYIDVRGEELSSPRSTTTVVINLNNETTEIAF